MVNTKVCALMQSIVVLFLLMILQNMHQYQLYGTIKHEFIVLGTSQQQWLKNGFPLRVSKTREHI
jgi:hypothetical protein